MLSTHQNIRNKLADQAALDTDNKLNWKQRTRAGKAKNAQRWNETYFIHMAHLCMAAGMAAGMAY